jgi:hypothetical protein
MHFCSKALIIVELRSSKDADDVAAKLGKEFGVATKVCIIPLGSKRWY